MSESYVWSTSDEIRFLLSSEPKGISKKQFLLNYKEGMKYRSNWENINKEEVYKALEQEIMQL